MEKCEFCHIVLNEHNKSRFGECCKSCFVKMKRVELSFYTFQRVDNKIRIISSDEWDNEYSEVTNVDVLKQILK